MDDPGAAGSLLPLSDPEHRFYSACLRSVCPRDDSGERLSPGKVAELFRASQLPPESLRKVTEVCGAKRLGFFGKPQFFVALKLIAAAQSGLPIRPESVTSNLPLPRFVGLKNEPELRYSNVPPGVEGQGTPCGTSSVPWTPADRRHLEATAEKTETRSPPRSPCASPPPSPPTYRSFPYIKQKNGADAQIMYESKQSSRPMVQLEQHHSPSHYRTKASVEHPAMARASSAERLDHHAAGDHSDDDPWRITEEQLEYYTNQFKSLQPDLGALVLGAVAKNFFTKSKLPIPELSHIWELSDVDRDGALTFSEFCTAFHLIVARKNGYALPESLPPTLRPGFLQQEDVPDTPESAEPLIVFEDAELKPSHMDQSIFDRIQSTAKQDLKSEESRKQDVSLQRLTSSQRKQNLQLGAFPHRPEPPQELDPQMRTKTRPRSYSSTSIEDAMKKAEEPPTPPPRPQKSHSRASSLDLNKLLQQGAPGIKSGWLLPPPALPPRPSATQVSHFINATEKKPPSQVQQPNFADFSHFREEDENCVKPERNAPHTEDSANPSTQDATAVCPNQAPQKPVRRKYHPESGNPETAAPPSMTLHQPPKPAQKLLSRQKREIQMAIRKSREAKAVLTRLNSELQQQLKVVHQERVTLESQLELLRPLALT